MNGLYNTSAADSPLPRDLSQKIKFEQKLGEMQSTSLPSWSKFIAFIEQGLLDVPELLDLVRRHQKELLGVCRALCPGNPNQSVLESAAVFLISVFYESIHIAFETKLTATTEQRIKDMFGFNCKKQLLIRANECVKSILEMVDVQSLHTFFQMTAMEKSSGTQEGRK